MSFLEKCDEYFGTTDFYDILKLERDANANSVKKAYHKASLLIHPDRVPDQQKLEATEKFKAISKIYSVLSDEEKRKSYDESGSFDEEYCDNLTEWLNVWRSMFKPITVDSIDKYKAEYTNSESELRDIKKSYVATKGNMTKMHNMVPFLDVANEERIIGIVRKLVDDGEVDEYDGFFNEPKAKKIRRKRKEDSYTVTDEEAEKLRQEFLSKRANREKEFAEKMAELERKYCTKKPVPIKGRKAKQGNTTAKKRVTRGRVVKQGRK